jgi:hypothetical protein
MIYRLKMLTLTLNERKMAIEFLLKKEQMNLTHVNMDEIAKTWEAQGQAPYPEILFIQFFSSLCLRIFGISLGLTIISSVPFFSQAFRTWIFSLIGMGSHEN